MLTIKELRYLRVLAHSSTMSEAASRSGLTVSAISQSLSQIEEKIGLQLFVRRRNGLEMTRFGVSILERAGRILGELDKLAFDIEALKSEHLGAVRYAIGPAVADLLQVDALTDFSRVCPGSVPRFRVKFWDDAEKSLLRGDVDLFIGGLSRDVNDSRYHWEAFYKDRVITLARRDHPLMKQSTVSIRDVIHYPVLSHDTRHFVIWRGLEMVGDLELMERNVPASVIDNPLEMLPLLKTTDHILLTTTANWLKIKADYPDVDALPVEDMRGTANMYFVSRSGYDLSETEQQLVHSFRRAARALFARIDFHSIDEGP